MTNRVSLGAALFFALLAATLLTAVLVVRARTPDLVLEVTAGLDAPCSLDSDPLGPDEGVEITFFVRESDDAARVAIVDSREEVVRTLAESAPLSADQEVTYGWDGRNDKGARVAPGRYRLFVALPGDDREMVWPRRVSIDVPTTASACGTPEEES